MWFEVVEGEAFHSHCSHDCFGRRFYKRWTGIESETSPLTSVKKKEKKNKNWSRILTTGFRQNQNFKVLFIKQNFKVDTDTA